MGDGELLMPGEGAGSGSPGQLLGEDFAGSVGVDEGFDAPFVAQGKQAGAGFACGGEGAKDDVEADGRLLDSSFGEARDLEKAAGDGGIAGGVEGGGRLGLVGRGGGAGIKVGAGANGDFDVMKGAFGFDDTVPVERGARFGEGGNFAGEFAAVGAGFEGGHGVAMEDHARAEIKKQDTKQKNGAELAAGAFPASTDFFGDETAEKREKNSGEKNCEEAEVERGKPVQSEAASGERPEKFDAGGLANVEDEVKEARGERGDEDGGARGFLFRAFGFEEEERKSDENAECESGDERVKVSAIESEIGGRAEVSAEEIHVGNRAREDNGDRGCAGEAREGSALKS
jgi:hypothetical protein